MAHTAVSLGMKIFARAAAAAMLFVSLPLAAQLTPLARGFGATAEQRVAPPRGGAVEADDQHLVGILPGSSGLTALSWRSCCAGISPRVQTLHSVQIDRSGRPDASSERQLTNTLARAEVHSTGLQMVSWTAGGSLRISPLKPDGTLEFPDGKILTTFSGAPAAQRTMMQCGPDICLVTWEFSQGIAFIVNGAGNIVARVSILQDAVPIAADDAGFLLIRATDTETRVVRLDAKGDETFHTVLREARIDAARADFDGLAYFVPFIDPYQNDEILVLQRVALDGTLTQQRELFEVPTGDTLTGLSIGANGSDHLTAVATAKSGIQGILVNSDVSVPRRAFTIINETDASNVAPLVVANGNDFFVAWEHAPLGSSAITKLLGSRVDPLGRMSSPAVLWHSGAAAQIPATIAATPSQSVAVWTESDVDTDGTLLRAARLSPAGVPTGTEIELGSARVIGSVDSAALGNDVLITWLTSSTAATEPNQLHATVVRGDGFVQQVALGSVSLRETSVASDGQVWLIAGIDAAGQLHTVRIASTGFALAGQATLLLAASAHAPVIASNGNGFLVAASVPGSGVFVVPLRADGTSAGNARLVTAPATTFDLASNGSAYMLVTAANGIATTLLNADGSIISGSQLQTATPAKIGVARMGGGWIVIWTTAGGSSFAARTNASGTFVEAPFAIDQLAVFAPKSPSSLAALFAKKIDNATATIYRELIETEALNGRRRSVHH